MAFMKSVVQVTKAIKSIQDLEDFHFTHKSALTNLIVVSGAGISSGTELPSRPGRGPLGNIWDISPGAVKPSCLTLICRTVGSEDDFGISQRVSQSQKSGEN